MWSIETGGANHKHRSTRLKWLRSQITHTNEKQNCAFEDLKTQSVWFLYFISYTFTSMFHQHFWRCQSIFYTENTFNPAHTEISELSWYNDFKLTSIVHSCRVYSVVKEWFFHVLNEKWMLQNRKVKELKWNCFKFIYTLFTDTYNDMSKKKYIFIYTNQYEVLKYRLIKTSLYLQETWFALKSLK